MQLANFRSREINDCNVEAVSTFANPACTETHFLPGEPVATSNRGACLGSVVLTLRVRHTLRTKKFAHPFARPNYINRGDAVRLPD
jgi:hypothetical protein